MPDPEPDLVVDIVRLSDAWRDADIPDTLIERAARAAFAGARPADVGPCDVAIVLSDDAEQRRLNAAFRGKDAPTNVLSFPSGETVGPACIAPLGDVVIAHETVTLEAKEEGKDLAAHVAHLVVHGVLHLLGHDHEDDQDANAMESLETRLMTELGYADPHAPVEEPAR